MPIVGIKGRDIASGAGRVLGSVGIWCVGFVVWVCLGLAWLCAALWKSRGSRLGNAVLVFAALGTGLGVGIVWTALSLPILFAAGEWIGRWLGRC